MNDLVVTRLRTRGCVCLSASNCVAMCHLQGSAGQGGNLLVRKAQIPVHSSGRQ